MKFWQNKHASQQYLAQSGDVLAEKRVQSRCLTLRLSACFKTEKNFYAQWRLYCQCSHLYEKAKGASCTDYKKPIISTAR